MIKILLSSRKFPDLFAIIDDEDYELINKFVWHPIPAHKNKLFYAGTNVTRDGKRAKLRMHRLILPNETTMDIDHINGDGLDNRRSNLRLATRSQNLRNSGVHVRNKSSVYKGVYRQKAASKWRARIYYNQKRISLGFYTSEIEAALAYDQAARQLFGEYARLNFPEGDIQWTLSVNSGLLVPQDHEDISQSRALFP